MTSGGSSINDFPENKLTKFRNFRNTGMIVPGKEVTVRFLPAHTVPRQALDALAANSVVSKEARWPASTNLLFSTF